MFSNKKHFLTKHVVVLLVISLSTSLLGFAPSEGALSVQGEEQIAEVTGGDADEVVLPEDGTDKDSSEEDKENGSDPEADSNKSKPNDDVKNDEPGTEDEGLNPEDTDRKDSESTDISDENTDDISPDTSDDNVNSDTENVDPENSDPETENEVPEDSVDSELLADITLEYSGETQFNTLADLLKTDIPVGTTVKTNGYASAGDGGASTYLVVAEPTTDAFFATKMANKKYAQLVLSETINVAQVGILPGNEISELFAKLVNAAEGNKTIKTIQFNDGTYIIDKPVKLQSFNYKGTGKTVLSISKQVKRTHHRMLYTAADEKHSSYTMNFSDIDFTMETCSDHTMVDTNTVVLALEEIDGCKVTNCNFKAYPSEKNGAFMIVDLLWFLNSKRVANIEVSNCSFYNLTGDAYKGNPMDTLKGGCLWFNGKGNPWDCTLENIYVHDCDFMTTLTDEAYAVWNGKTTNVIASNCTFKNRSHDCHNIITFFCGTFKDTIVKDCQFVLDAPSTRVCKVMELTGDSEVVFDNLDFTFNSGIKDRKRNTYVFQTSKDSEYATGDAPGKVIIKNCRAKCNNGTGYGSFLGLYGANLKTYEITGCNIDVPCESGLVYENDVSRNTIKVTGNTINTHGKLMSMKIAKLCRYVVDNNTILNNPGAEIFSSASAFYRFSNNTCKDTSNATMLSCYDLQKKHFIYYYNAGNKFKSGVKVKDFSSNNKLKESDIIIKTEKSDGSEINKLLEEAYPGGPIEKIEKDDPDKKGSGDTPEEKGSGDKPEEKGKGEDSKEKVPEDKPAEDASKTVPEAPMTTEASNGQKAPFSVIVDDVTYTISENGNATVDAIGEIEKVSINTVASDGVEYPVTKIAAKACKGNKTLKKLTIGKNVKSIGKNAFKGCKKLKKITIKANKSLKIKKGAFKGLPKDAKITIKGLKKKTKSKIVEAVKKQTNAAVK